jgi:hypothetical protein
MGARLGQKEMRQKVKASKTNKISTSSAGVCTNALL